MQLKNTCRVVFAFWQSPILVFNPPPYPHPDRLSHAHAEPLSQKVKLSHSMFDRLFWHLCAELTKQRNAPTPEDSEEGDAEDDASGSQADIVSEASDPAKSKCAVQTHPSKMVLNGLTRAPPPRA